MKTRNLFFLILIPLLLWAPQVLAAELPIGSECAQNSDCKYNDCEKSTILNEKKENKWYCDCSTDGDCFAQYDGPPKDGGKWGCIDGADTSYDLDYCLSDKKKDIRFAIAPQEPSVIDALLDPTATVAALQYDNELSKLIAKPTPKITIPGLNFSEPQATNENGGKFLYIPFLGEYIAALYKYGVAVASIFAVVMIINQGFGWAISGGSSEKITQHKKRIAQCVVGLLLAVGSYTLLYMINPNLVEFKSLRIPYIETIPLQSEEWRNFWSSASADEYFSDSSEVSIVNGKYKFVSKFPKNFHFSAKDIKPYQLNEGDIKTLGDMSSTDPCLWYAIMKTESGATTKYAWSVIGDDENSANVGEPSHVQIDKKTGKKHCSNIGARRMFLVRGHTYKGVTFPALPKEKTFNPCTDSFGPIPKSNGGPILNDDDPADFTKPPDYGIDWGITDADLQPVGDTWPITDWDGNPKTDPQTKATTYKTRDPGFGKSSTKRGFSHGIGLVQETIIPGKDVNGSRKIPGGNNGQLEWAVYSDAARRWYTVTDLLVKDMALDNMAAKMAGVMNSAISCKNKPTCEYKDFPLEWIVFTRWGGGTNSIKRKSEAYNKCPWPHTTLPPPPTK